MKNIRMLRRISLIIALVCVFTSFCFADVLDSWQDDAAYKPNPVLFLHGFAKGKPSDWNRTVSSLRGYFSKYSQQTYLEVINFNDPNGSVDTYSDGRDGWSDKVEDKVNELLDSNKYGFYADKVNLVCHSMGGLAARWYLANYSSDYVDKLILIGVPNLGSRLARWGNFISKIPKLGWTSILSINVYNSRPKNDLAIAIDMLLEIDVYGDAIDDLDNTNTGSDFLRNLNESGQSSDVDYYGIIGTDGHLLNWLVAGDYFGGDGIVSKDSQRGIGYIDFKQETSIYANHWREIEIASDPNDNKILQFLDSTIPELEITSPDPSIITETKERFIHIKGRVYKEYLPADTQLIMDITRQEDGYSLPQRTSFLKPSDLWVPNNPDSPIAEFDETIFLPGEGTYDIACQLKNPAGQISDIQTISVKVKAEVEEWAHLIVHCYNPEGREFSADAIYDGDKPLSRVNMRIAAGEHTIRVAFNGMIKEQSVTIEPNETKVLTFIFERTEYTVPAPYFEDIVNESGYAESNRETSIEGIYSKFVIWPYAPTRVHYSINSELIVDGWKVSIRHKWNLDISPGHADFRYRYDVSTLICTVPAPSGFKRWYFQATFDKPSGGFKYFTNVPRNDGGYGEITFSRTFNIGISYLYPDPFHSGWYRVFADLTGEVEREEVIIDNSNDPTNVLKWKISSVPYYPADL